MKKLNKLKSRMTLAEARRALLQLKEDFDGQPAANLGLPFLRRVYRLVRQNIDSGAFCHALDRCLERRPTTTNIFSHVIEATMSIDRKLRWRYARVLTIANSFDVPAKHFAQFVRDRGGLSAVIAIGRSQTK
jgi:hypothetical protein